MIALFDRIRRKRDEVFYGITLISDTEAPRSRCQMPKDIWDLFRPMSKEECPDHAFPAFSRARTMPE